MPDILEVDMSRSNTKPVVAIEPEQFRADYQTLPQAALMRKYGITSTKLMRLIRAFIPPTERYAAKVRSGFVPAGSSRTADVS